MKIMPLSIAFLFFVSIALVFAVDAVSDVKINEVEINPPGKDLGNEWIELYSEEELNLDGWKLINNDQNEKLLSGSFSGYFVIVFEKQWLDNKDEKIFLYKGDNLIDETPLFADPDNDNKTWQFCEEWIFLEQTREEHNCRENKAVEEEEDRDTNENNKNADEENEKNGEENKMSANIEIEKPEQKLDEKENKSSILDAEIIKLGNELKTQNIKTDNILYVSKNEKIKKYSIYGFAFLCVMLSLLLIFNKLKN